MGRPVFLPIGLLTLLVATTALAVVVEHTFIFPTPSLELMAGAKQDSQEAMQSPGEWWNANVVDVLDQAIATGGLPNISDAYTINGLPGNLYQCSQNPGPYYTAAIIPLDNTTTRGVIVYRGASPTTTPLMPALPARNDTPTAHKFYSNLNGLKDGPYWVQVPRHVDYEMFVTIGLGLEPCAANKTCLGPLGARLSASMNNQSLVLPRRLSLLQAFYSNVDGVYSTDFPAKPHAEFDYTNGSINANNPAFFFAPKDTKVTKLKFNSTVEMVLQNTAIIGVENHPMHIHGVNFHVLAQGFGNYNADEHRIMFNLVDPQIRNTIGVPVGGWAVLRFTANNPGVWLMHCHLDSHLEYGFATVFVVENGATSETTLPPPPADLPKC
ncbi:hypothetical protein V6N13_100939 [Hibiscus sabdariffa]